MGYKFKPAKAVAKRFKVTKTGKLKRHHAFTSHLMSARPAKTRRKLRRAAILFEGHARNMRAMMGISHLKPAQTEHERALAEKRGGDGTDPRSARGGDGTDPRRARGGDGAEPRSAAKPRQSQAATKAPARAGAAKPRA
jgi:large subunit ribosomal protein L35